MSDGKIRELNEKIDKLARVLGSGQRHVSFVDDHNQGPSQEPYQEDYGMSNNDQSMGQQEDCSYINNYNKPFNQSHPNLSYRSTNVENPQDQIYPPQHQPFNPRPQGNNFIPRPQGYNNFQGQGSNQPLPNYPQQQGTFPRGNNFQQGGNFQGNFPQPQGSSHDDETKAMLKQIMDGLARTQLQQAEFQKETQRRIVEMQAEIERAKCQNAQASSSKEPTSSFPSKPEMNPKAQCNMIALTSVEEFSEPKEDEHDKFEVAKPKEKSFFDGLDEKTRKILFEPPPYEPPLPFPSRLKDQLVNVQRKRFIEIMDAVMVTLPLKEVIDNSPTWTKFFKEMLIKKNKMEQSLKNDLERKKDVLQIEPSPKVKTLVKQPHPGKFIIPCSLGSFKIDDALCDSGAFVNVISSELVEELGITGMQPNLTSLTFGDASTKFPKGKLEDYPLKVGDCIVPTDLIVLDMVGSKKRPLILGAPFLTTVGANIDYEKKVVMLKNVDAKVYYAIEPPVGFCGTITMEEDMIEPREPNEVKDAPNLVKYSFEVDTKLHEPEMETFGNWFEDVLEVDTKLVDVSQVVIVKQVAKLEKNPKDVVPVVKKAKPKKKKLEKAKCVIREPKHPPLTFKPLMFIDGKLECKVMCKGGSKPFAKAQILFPPNDKTKSMIPDSMALAFGIKLGDRGPFKDVSLPPLSNPVEA